ncbi:phage tail-collar fiber domain-containing protein [Citrobacter braakii]|uniref:phage tail-collar fiber domain-containing protein n=1 Tax=Citrobacter braakii TaxID=57706 RepID=UPI00403A5823
MASNLVLTAVGAAAIEAAYNAGEVVEITVAQIGDGGGAPVIADPATESLVNSFGSVPFSGGHNNDYMISGEVVIPAGNFPGNIIREVGLISRDGILIAYGAYPETWLPADETSVLKSVTIDFMMPIVHAESVVLVVDPDTAILTPTVADTLYLRQDKHLSEIAGQGEAAQTDARKNLALGTAATLDATTSTTDDTPGRVLTVGYEGIGGDAARLVDDDFNQLSPSGFIRGQTNAPVSPTLFMGFNVRHVGAYQFTIVGRNKRYFAQTCEAGEFQGWDEFYHTGNKPTADDVGAIPKDPIGTIVNNGSMASASTPGWWLVSVADPDTVADFPVYPDGSKLYGYGFMFVARSGSTWLQQYFAHHGQSASRQTWNGTFSAAPWVVDYSTANAPPTPDLSAYATSDWVRSYFVQATRFGANLSDHWGGSGGTVPPGCALTGGDFNSDNEYPIYAYMQYLINGVWINASGGVGAASRVSGSHYRAVPENGISSLINLRPYLRESNDPVDLPGVPHFIDDAGYDWFEAAPKLTGRVFIAVAPDTGVIVQIADSSLPDTDAFSLYPDGVSIYGLEALPPDCSIDGTWRFDSETLTAYRDAELAAGRILSENTRLRTQFATQAMLAISTLQNRVSIGRARAGDADALAAWQNYLIDLDELTDAQLASADFVFPSTPQ